MSNRVAVLTGADGGLGHTVAACLAKDGCRLVLGHPPAVGSTSRPAATSYLVAADVTSETDVRGLIASAVGDFGRIDVLVTLAGVMEQRFLPELDLATWNHTLAINLTGTFLCVSTAAKELRHRCPSTSPAAPSVAGVEGTHSREPPSDTSPVCGGFRPLPKTDGRIAYHQVRGQRCDGSDRSQSRGRRSA